MEAYGQSPSDEVGYLIYCPTQEDLEDDFIEDLKDGFIWGGGGNDVMEDDKSGVQIGAQSLYRDGNANVAQRIVSTRELSSEKLTIGADEHCGVNEEKVTGRIHTNYPLKADLELDVCQRQRLKIDHCSLLNHHDPSLVGVETASLDSSNCQGQSVGTDHLSNQTTSHHDSGLGGDYNAEMTMDSSNHPRKISGTDLRSNHHHDHSLGGDCTVETAPIDSSNSQGKMGTDQRSNHHHDHSLRGDRTVQMAPMDPSNSNHNSGEIKRSEAARYEVCERTRLYKYNCYCNACNPSTVGPRSETEKRHQCSVCNKGFNYNIHLTRHMRTHTGEKPYQCSLCGKAFGQKSSLGSHLKSHVDGFEYYCTICNRGCRSKSSLEGHLRTHTGEKPFECPICKKSFSTQRILARHNLVHTGEKPHQCTVCNRGFAQRHTLLLHIATHSDEKLFECSVCKGRYRSKRSLEQHMTRHTGARPHQCSVCSKSFNHAAAFYRHKRTHTGEKPYQCSMCSQRFTQSCSRVRHMKTAHSGERSETII